jgi:thiamine kinase-like enzyme
MLEGTMDEQIEAILQRIPELRDRPRVITPLVGGITNRNYRIDAGGQSYVLRIGGAGANVLGIDRVAEYACTRAAASSGVGPEIIAFLPEHAALVTRYVDGRVLTTKDVQEEATLERVVHALRRIHNGALLPCTFSPFLTIREYHNHAHQLGVAFPPTIHEALDLLGRLEDALAANIPFCPCHNDLLPANFIDDGTTIRIIDWEYAGMGDRFFDLGNLAANHDFTAQAERRLLALYFGGVQTDDLRRLRLMRLVSDLREALWGFVQSGTSALDFDFLAYGNAHLNRFLEAAPRGAMDLPRPQA